MEETAVQKAMNRRVYSLLVILFSIIVGGWLLRGLSLRDFVVFFPQIHWKWVALAIAVMILSNVLRVFRMQLLLTPAEPFWRLFWIQWVSSLAVNLVPFRAGDAALPLLLKRVSGRKLFKEGLPLLLIIRLADVVVMTLLLAVLCGAGLLVLPKALHSLCRFLGLFGLSFFMFGMMMVVFRRRMIRLLQKTLLSFGANRSIEKVIKKVTETLEALHWMSGLKRGLSLFILSVALWGAMSLYGLFILWGMNLPLPGLDGFFISFLSLAILTVPITAFWGLGTSQGVALFLLIPFGYPQGTILTSLFSAYPIPVIVNIGMVLMALLFLRRDLQDDGQGGQ